jgi:hypothetical protein
MANDSPSLFEEADKHFEHAAGAASSIMDAPLRATLSALIEGVRAANRANEAAHAGGEVKKATKR